MTCEIGNGYAVQFVVYHLILHWKGERFGVVKDFSERILSGKMETVFHYSAVDVQDVPLSRIPETQGCPSPLLPCEVFIQFRPSF